MPETQEDRSDSRDDAAPEQGRLTGPARRILASISLLPAFLTLANGLSGFAAIYYATREGLGQAGTSQLATAAWFIIAALACDMLDGRLARMTRRTSDFGGQLDSLCDVISFGVAPAVLMLHTVLMALRTGMIAGVPALPVFERVVWFIAAVYVACAALRLARFNVENEPDESAHMDFEGLPSPGAAAVVVVFVLLLHDVQVSTKDWTAADWLPAAICAALPPVTLAAGLLMVSRLPYLHLVNQYVRGRRPFSYLVKLVVILLAALVEVFVTGLVVAVAYMLSGPIRALAQKTGRLHFSDRAE